MKYMLVILEANLPKNPVSIDLENSTQEWHQQRLPEFEFHRERDVRRRCDSYAGYESAQRFLKIGQPRGTIIDDTECIVFTSMFSCLTKVSSVCTCSSIYCT